MELKESLDKFFQVYKKPISISEIIKKIKINDKQIPILEQNLYELEVDGKIYCDKNKMYMHVPKEFYLYHGVLKNSNKNQMYINLENGNRINIPKKYLNGAKENDVVFVSKNMKKSKYPNYYDGKVVRIVKKEQYFDNDTYITNGILKKDGDTHYILKDNYRIYIPFEDLNNSYIGDLVNVQVTNKTKGKVIEILKSNSREHVFKCINKSGELKWIPYGSSYKEYDLDSSNFKDGDLIIATTKNDKLEFIKKIGNSSILNSQIASLIIDYGFNIDFSEEVLNEAENISPKITEDVIKKRIDLRNLETFTIDPPSAKDLDDAISLEYNDNNYRLYVHIADPANYIKLKSKTFEEALKRCFSIYPSNYVVPMLPKYISNNICSLNENEDRLTITCQLDIDKSGNVTNVNIYKSIINSNKKMSYDKVNDILDNKILYDDYKEFIPTLLKMNELSNILQKLKINRGAICIESQKHEFSVDDVSNPIEIKDEQRGPAQLMIENFMIVSNESVTSFAYYLNLPFVYRNHEKPDISKTSKMITDLKDMGYTFPKIVNLNNQKNLQGLLKSIMKGKNIEEQKHICNIILQSFSRAYYDYMNIGHYGLALDCYGTFTSPIRKVSDLLNHISLTIFLENGLDLKKLESVNKVITESCEYISEKQKNIDIVEKEVDNLLLKKYSENYISSKLTATILFVNKNGIYVKTSNGLSGFVKINKNYKIYNNYVVNEKDNTIYRVGDRIEVILNEIVENQISFTLPKIIEKNKNLVKK